MFVFLFLMSGGYVTLSLSDSIVVGVIEHVHVFAPCLTARVCALAYLQACCCSSSSAICPTSPHSRSPTQSRPASAGAVRGRPSLSHPSSLESAETKYLSDQGVKTAFTHGYHNGMKMRHGRKIEDSQNVNVDKGQVFFFFFSS